jgi:hypothetical protein
LSARVRVRAVQLRVQADQLRAQALPALLRVRALPDQLRVQVLLNRLRALFSSALLPGDHSLPGHLQVS